MLAFIETLFTPLHLIALRNNEVCVIIKYGKKDMTVPMPVCVGVFGEFWYGMADSHFGIGY